MTAFEDRLLLGGGTTNLKIQESGVAACWYTPRTKQTETVPVPIRGDDGIESLHVVSGQCVFFGGNLKDRTGKASPVVAFSGALGQIDTGFAPQSYKCTALAGCPAENSDESLVFIAHLMNASGYSVPSNLLKPDHTNLKLNSCFIV